MSEAYKCDYCLQLFEGDPPNYIYISRKMLKKDYCLNCWSKLIKLAGTNIEEELGQI